MTPEQRLWQSVLLTAVQDAVYDGENVELQNAQRAAAIWLDKAGRDFREVCTLAGMDPQFIADAWRNGKLTKDSLKAATKYPAREGA